MKRVESKDDIRHYEGHLRRLIQLKYSHAKPGNTQAPRSLTEGSRHISVSAKPRKLKTEKDENSKSPKGPLSGRVSHRMPPLMLKA
jgi:hypothetical protein